MKILCLHGHGTSARIFKAQTASFRAKLDRSWQFDFIDAPFPSAPTPGIDVFFSDSGNYTWWLKNTVQAIRAAHLWLEDYLADHGPYDGVCCFSQGCSLVSSYLLYHAREAPGSPPPFGFAVFICGGLPFTVLEDLGLPVPRRALDINERTGKLLGLRTTSLYEKAREPSQIKKGMGLWDDTSDLLHDPARLPDPADVFGLDFTQFPADARIRIPTLHVYGAKDPRWPSGVQLAYFCDDRIMYDHGGGHEVPRSAEVSARIAEMLESVSQRASAPSKD